MKNRKLLSLALAGLLSLSLTACGGDDQTSTGDKVYKVGISQYVTHPALDDATEGFIAAMNDKLGEDGWEYDLQNAAEDPALCSTIAGTFVSDGVDLIMANATPALQAAAAATGDIPILGTSEIGRAHV